MKLEISPRPSRTITGGSHTYVNAVAAVLGDRVRVADPVARVRRENDGITLITERGTTEHYDQVIFACHADTTRALLIDADDAENDVLSAFDYQPNRAVLHSDPRLMPQRRRVWSSWNYAADRADISNQRVAVTYWMNRLQAIPGDKSYFVSLNPLYEPLPEHVIAEIHYAHPVFTRRAIQAQGALADIQGRGGVFYCGAWTGYGFHEDGLKSAVRVAERLGVSPPWAG